METIIDRLEAIHRALRTAPALERRDVRVAETVEHCLRDLHAIAAQECAGGRPSLRLIEGGAKARPASLQRKSGASLAQAGHVMLRQQLGREETAP